MKFKKLLPLFLACVLVFLSACSSNQAELTTTSITKESTTSTTQATTKEATTKKLTTTSTISQETTKKTTKNSKPSTTDTSTTKTTTAIKDNTTQKATKTTTTTTTKKSKPYCTLTIECKEILNNMSDLKLGHEKYVPSNGYILKDYKVEYEQDDTAYDILKKGCKSNSIKLTAKSTGYGTYVVGINNLDEFDCGTQSGWLYKINSAYPNISSSKQKVNPNDAITFEYTCSY